MRVTNAIVLTLFAVASMLGFARSGSCQEFYEARLRLDLSRGCRFGWATVELPTLTAQRAVAGTMITGVRLELRNLTSNDALARNGESPQIIGPGRKPGTMQVVYRFNVGDRFVALLAQNPDPGQIVGTAQVYTGEHVATANQINRPTIVSIPQGSVTYPLSFPLTWLCR